MGVASNPGESPAVFPWALASQEGKWTMARDGHKLPSTQSIKTQIKGKKNEASYMDYKRDLVLFAL